MWLRVAARVLNAEGKRMGHQLARGERGGGVAMKGHHFASFALSISVTVGLSNERTV